MGYGSPANLIELLDRVVGAAYETAFYRSVMRSRPWVSSLEEFGRIPVTPIEEYRAQSLADVITDSRRVQWLAASLRGRSAAGVAVAEDFQDAATRYQVFKDALAECLPERPGRTGVVVSTGETRYYAAEISTILSWSAVPSHVFTLDDNGTIYDRLRQIAPQVVAFAACRAAESELPPSVELCITFRGAQRLTCLPQVDMYVVDGLGFLAHSTDLRSWLPYNDEFYFETSERGRLVVTALHRRTQPMVRIETRDAVKSLGAETLELAGLTASG